MKKFLFRQFQRVYRLSRWFKLHFTLTGQLLLGALLTASIFGLDMRQTHAYQLFSVLLAVLLLAILSGHLGLRFQFRMQRRLPEFAMANQAFHYTLSIQNQTKHRHQQLLVKDELHPNENNQPAIKILRHPLNWLAYPRWLWSLQMQQGALTQAQTLSQLDAEQTHEIHYEITPLRRGYLYFDQCVVGISEPLGLYNKLFYQHKADKLLVLPKLYQMPSLALGDKRSYQAGGIAQTVSVAEAATEFMSLREYRAGDALRNIHWKSWAKRGKPIVKQYQDEYYTRHALILDTFIQQEQETAFEEAVSLAASFASHLVNQDSLLDLLFVGDKAYQYTSGHGVSSVSPMLEILACVQPCYTPSFKTLGALLQKNRNALSGGVYVLLAWDEPRQMLVKKLQQQGLPLTLFLITATPEAYQTVDLPNNLHVLPHDDIQHSLSQL